jgi:hypothetical protein
MICVIGDLHITEKRLLAVTTSLTSILKSIKEYTKNNGTFTEIVLLGDITHTSPSAKERVIFQKFLIILTKYTRKITIIKGTDGHDFDDSTYNFADTELLVEAFSKDVDISFKDEYRLGSYIFGHYEVSGCVYSNGMLGSNKYTIDKDYKYILGHIHKPQEFENIIYVGSIYKVSFAEKTEDKRFLIINNNQYEFIPIETTPMHELDINIEDNKIKLTAYPTNINKTLAGEFKLNFTTDKNGLLSIDNFVKQFKEAYKVISIKQSTHLLGTEVPIDKSTSEDDLLKKYCTQKKLDYTLIKEEYDKC